MRTCLELFTAFLRLGFTCFGGPTAHLGYFRQEFVVKRRWLDDHAYADLVALCQFLPGPASSQVVFGIGLRQFGFVGGVAASLGFMLPSAVAMIVLGYGVASWGAFRHGGWLHGLMIAAAAVVAQAVAAMWMRLCTDWPLRLLATLSAALVLVVPGAFEPPVAIAVCALLGGWIYRHETTALDNEPDPPGGKWGAAVALGSFAVLLFVFPMAARLSGSRTLEVFDGFYRAGSLVFGGGHVVLPLLRSEIVGPGWVGDDRFMAGYGAAQALPGPLFTFAGYLGTVIGSPGGPWVGGVLALLAIFLPAWLLVGGVYPFWHRLRRLPWVRSGLKGANAAVVGLLLGALYQPVSLEAILSPWDGLAALGALALLTVGRLPAWAVVLLSAAVGQWVLR